MDELVALVTDAGLDAFSPLLDDLRRDGFWVELRSRQQLLRELETLKPSVLVLDIATPGPDDLELCRRIRRTSAVPIVILSGSNQCSDAVDTLNVGADDYITKPYRKRELIARIRAMLRRSALQPPPPDLPPGPLTVGRVTIDPQAHTVLLDRQRVDLPLKEFDLLHALMSNAGRVVTRTTLINQIWGRDYYGDTKTIDVHVLRLRRKLERNRATPPLIVTVRGVGYRFEKPKHGSDSAASSQRPGPTANVATSGITRLDQRITRVS